LIVDDDPRMRELADFAARTSGAFAEIDSVADGQAALDYINRTGELPDVILTDLTMPRMTGLGLVEALQRDPRLQDIPVIMLSSSGDPVDRENAIAAGCRAFYQKPGTLSALTAIMREIGAIASHV
jgi:CheY-like chemotaxis protein